MTQAQIEEKPNVEKITKMGPELYAAVQRMELNSYELSTLKEAMRNGEINGIVNDEKTGELRFADPKKGQIDEIFHLNKEEAIKTAEKSMQDFVKKSKLQIVASKPLETKTEITEHLGSGFETHLSGLSGLFENPELAEKYLTTLGVTYSVNIEEAVERGEELTQRDKARIFNESLKQVQYGSSKSLPSFDKELKDPKNAKTVEQLDEVVGLISLSIREGREDEIASRISNAESLK
jgi:hypothetical protein